MGSPDEVEDEATDLTPEQAAELDRRIDAYERDRDPGEPADVVLDRIRARVR